MIELSDGQTFDGTNPDEVLRFETEMAKRSKDDNTVRKDIALGNFNTEMVNVAKSDYAFLTTDDKIPIAYQNLNRDARMIKLGYQVSGRNGQVILSKDGKAVNLREYAWSAPHLQNQLEPNAREEDIQFTDPLATNYVKVDGSFVKKYIYDNVTEDGLQEIEAMKLEARTNLDNIRKQSIANGEEAYTREDVIKSYRESNEYKDRYKADLKEFKVSDKAIKTIFNNPEFFGLGADGSYGVKEITQEAQDMLPAEDLLRLRKTLRARKVNKTFEAGLKTHKEQMEDSYVQNVLTKYLDDDVTKSMKGVYAAAIEGTYNVDDEGNVTGFGELYVQKTKAKLEIDMQNLEKGAEDKVKEIESLANSIVKDAAKNNIGIDYVNDMYVAVGGSQVDREPILKRLSILNNAQRTANEDFEKIKSTVVKDHLAYQEIARTTAQESDLITREYGNWNLLATKFEDRVHQMALVAPMLLKEKQKYKENNRRL